MHPSSPLLWAASLSTAITAASAHPVPASAPWSATSPLVVHSDDTTETSSAHASFNFTCRNCLSSQDSRSLYSQLDLPFNLAVLPGKDFCDSTLSLNAATLTPLALGGPAPRIAKGTSTITASDHDIGIDWSTACFAPDDEAPSSSSSAVQVLSVKLTSIDGQDFTESSIAGFTLSFKDDVSPEFLRLAAAYSDPDALDKTWTTSSTASSTAEAADPELQSHLKDLQYLQAEAQIIHRLIWEQKHLVAVHLSHKLKASISRCDGVLCYVETVFSHAHKSVSTFLPHRKSNPYTSFLDPQGFVLKGAAKQGIMAVSMQNQTAAMHHHNHPSPPEKCHVKEGHDSASWPELPERPSTGRSSPRVGTSNASSLSILLQNFFAFTGIAFLFACLKRCCCSRRKTSRSRAARERVTINRGRKRGFWAWVSRKKAVKRAEVVSQTFRNIDEKRGRVEEQEKVLEGYMQDEIQQLEIHEELRQLQNTRNEVDELIRAEEGRHHHAAPPYQTNPLDPSTLARNSISVIHHYPMPQPIAIPHRQQSLHDEDHHHHLAHASPRLSCSAHSDNPFSPMSRTTSLPSYRSKPPSYQGDGESSYAFSDSDEMSDNDGEHDDHWTESDQSSLPDLSPRPSGETLATHYNGETARMFL